MTDRDPRSVHSPSPRRTASRPSPKRVAQRPSSSRPVAPVHPSSAEAPVFLESDTLQTWDTYHRRQQMQAASLHEIQEERPSIPSDRPMTIETTPSSIEKDDRQFVYRREEDETTSLNLNDIPEHHEPFADQTSKQEADLCSNESEKEGLSSKKHKKRKKKRLTVFSKLILSFFLISTIVFGLKLTGILGTEIVIGTSMVPSFHTKDLVISSSLAPIERYDVIVASAPTGNDVIKRVIGLPGDKVSYRNRHIFINDRPTDEDMIEQNGQEINTDLYGDIVLGPDEYFVAGDNRDNSSDSRVYGPLAKKDIHGKVLLKIPSSGEKSPWQYKNKKKD